MQNLTSRLSFSPPLHFLPFIPFFPDVPASPHVKGFPPGCPSSKRQSQPNPIPAPRLAAKQQKIREGRKAYVPCTDEEGGLQVTSLPEDYTECEKPPGKRQCKTKHMTPQERKRKRLLLAVDDSMDIGSTDEKVLLLHWILQCGSISVFQLLKFHVFVIFI